MTTKAEEIINQQLALVLEREELRAPRRDDVGIWEGDDDGYADASAEAKQQRRESRQREEAITAEIQKLQQDLEKQPADEVRPFLPQIQQMRQINIRL